MYDCTCKHVLHSPVMFQQVLNIVHNSLPDLHCRIHTIQYTVESCVLDVGVSCDHMLPSNFAILLSTQPWPRQHPTHVMFVTNNAKHHAHSYNIYAPMHPVCSNMTAQQLMAANQSNHQRTRNTKQPTPSRRTIQQHKPWRQQSTATSCPNLNPCGIPMMA